MEDVANYSPISLLPIISKVIERIAHNRVYEHVSPFLATEQHAFIEKRSTVTNLTVFTEYIRNNMDSRHQIDVIYTDFNKAFDSVDLDLLLVKLSRFGLCGLLLSGSSRT